MASNGIGFCFLIVLARSLGLTDIDDEEPCVQSPLRHLRDVDLPITPDTGIDFLGGEVEGDVIMCIDGNDTLVNLSGRGQNLFFTHLRCTSCKEEERGE